jgi:hypothetical protein
MRPIAAAAAVLSVIFTASVVAQRGQAPAGPPPPARTAAPIDLTGYWVSLIVDEWRFRVTPQKGDILYMPLNQRARDAANAWDPDKDQAEGNACRAYGAVGVMQRPGRLHMTWDNDNALKLEADAGTQTRVLHFGQAAPASERGEPSWQGYSVAEWQVPGRRVILFGDEPAAVGARGGLTTPTAGPGSLKVVTTNMKPGYLRKNGVPYSANAVLTEYFNVIEGAEHDIYLTVTAMVEDPMYLVQPFVRTYTFKKETDGSKWEPTPCYPR